MNSPLLRFIFSGISGWKRFPLPILAALVATVVVMVSIHSSSTSVQEECTRIALTMVFGLPLLVGAVYGTELHPRFRWALHAVSLLLISGVFFLLSAGMPEGALWFRFLMLVLASFAAASAIPGLIREGSLNWWRVNVGWLNSAILAGIMTAIVEIGLQLALLSVGKLFGLDARYGRQMGHLHQDLFAIAGLLIGPGAALALFPPAKGNLDADQPGFKIWANLCKWALIPIGFLFMGILAVYALKIGIVRKLPHGMVAMPVLSLGAYGMMAMLLIQPWSRDHSWACWFCRIYPAAFLLSSILLFLSIAIRIREYGVTFDRYSALAAGIWLSVSALGFMLRRKGVSVLVPCFLLLTALMAALGPFSAGTLSLRSQSERLRLMLKSENRNDEQIESIVRMIIADFGLADLEKVTGPLGLDPKLNRWKLTDAALQKLHVSKEKSTDTVYELSGGTFVPIAGCTAYLAVPRDFNVGNNWSTFRPCLLGKSGSGEELILIKEDEPSRLILRAGKKEIASVLLEDLDFDVARKNKTPVLVTIEGEGRCFLILVTRARWGKSGKGKPNRVTDLDYQVFEKPPVSPKESHTP